METTKQCPNCNNKMGIRCDKCHECGYDYFKNFNTTQIKDESPTPTVESEDSFSRMVLILKEKDLHFRIEDDEELFYLSIIDRQIYPRVWADSFKDGAKIITESTDNLINRTMVGEKDWIIRFHNISVEELIKEVIEYLKSN